MVAREYGGASMNENPQTPEEVGQWLRDHGGPLRSEGPDANGIVTQYAVDGSWLRQRALPGGATQVLEVNPAAAAVPGGDGSPPPAAPPRGVGMTQQELEALLAQMGALGPGDFREETKTEDIPNPKYDGTDVLVPPTIKGPVTYRTWIKPGTNQRITVKVNPDGSYTKVFDGSDPSINPSKPSAAQPQTVSTNTTEPYIVTRMPDGSLRTEKNPNYKGPDPKPASQLTVKGGDGKTYIVSVDAQGNVTTRDTGVPGEQQAPYSQVTQDPQTGKWWGLKKDGSGWVELPGGPGATGGAARPAGPAMPTIVVGQSQAALRQYRDQLQAEVASGRQTQAWADARWAEAKDIATATINEATLLQRERESSLNANVNLATTRLNADTNAMKTALEFALSINGKLPEGSPLGGQAFAALLGMHMISAKRSGIYDIVPPNSDQRSLEGRGISSQASATTATSNSEISRLTNPGNPQAVQAQRAEVQAQLQAETAAGAPAVQAAPLLPPTPVPSAGAAYNPAMAAPPAAPAVQAAFPVVPPSHTQVAPIPMAPPVQGAPNEFGQIGEPMLTPVVNPATGEPTGLPQTPYAPPNSAPLPHEMTPPAGSSPSAPLPWMPQPSPPAQAGSEAGGNVQMAPPSEEFAALNAYRPTPLLAPTPVQPMTQPTMEEEPLALLQAEASATPPWRMTEEQYQRYKAAGIPDDVILSTPGMMVA